MLLFFPSGEKAEILGEKACDLRDSDEQVEELLQGEPRAHAAADNGAGMNRSTPGPLRRRDVGGKKMASAPRGWLLRQASSSLSFSSSSPSNKDSKAPVAFCILLQCACDRAHSSFSLSLSSSLLSTAKRHLLACLRGSSMN